MNLPALRDQAIGFHQAGNLEAAARLYSQILALDAGEFAARHMLGVVRYQQGKNEEAFALIGAALAINPDVAEALSNYALVLSALGRFEEALDYYNKALAKKPGYAEAFNNRGIALWALGRREEALASYDGALAIEPAYAEALNNRGNALRELERFEQALASYDKALAIRPDYAEAGRNRALAHQRQKNLEAALASDEGNLTAEPDLAETLNKRGSALRHLKRFDEALAIYDRILAVRPDYLDAVFGRGSVLRDLKRYDEVLASFRQAVAMEPDNAVARNNYGIALWDLKRFDEALASYDKALAINPDYAAALNNRGVALWNMKRLDEALASFDKSLAIKTDFVSALFNRGLVLADLKRFEDALASYDKVRALDPGHLYVLGAEAHAVLRLCDWRRAAKIAGVLKTNILEGKSVIQPFLLLGYGGDAALQFECAKRCIRDRMPVPPAPIAKAAPYRHDKIRIAYLSADFRKHATAYLTAELFERQDRARFEIFGISFGVDDGSDIRARLVRAFDQFHDIRLRSDAAAATLLRTLEVDIAVDLMGFTTDLRPEILSRRPAPVQVNYLGYPGTMGAQFMDYVIADRIIAPLDQQPFFAEKIVHLPDCYQANDSKRAIAEGVRSRRDAGLPQSGFVFCCFNDIWKITEPTFHVWMDLLGAVPGSVLWLIADNPGATANLQQEAAARGIDPGRLIFAPRVELAEHLARHRLADLFLDTLPCNAHTTASDALWAGLPVITCLGQSFPGRVAASLLHAVGLPELVTGTLREYENLALKLARNPPLLDSLRQKLERNRLTYPLFDIDRFRKNIETAYTRMWQAAERGEPAQGFSL